MTERLGGVLLAGGRSSRMGEDKALMRWDGRRAVDLAHDLARQAGCETILVAGRDYGYPFLADPAPDCGPAIALLAAIDRLSEIDRFLVLPVDAPTLRFADVSLLFTTRGRGAAFVRQPIPMQIRRDGAEKARGATSLHAMVQLAELREVALPQNGEHRIRGANTPQEAGLLRSSTDASYI